MVENSKVERNNSEHFNMSPVAGGLKVTQTRTVKVDGGVYSGNFGNGIWFDESVYDVKVVNATVQKNLGHGVEVELSAKFIIANNIITGNGKIEAFFRAIAMAAESGTTRSSVTSDRTSTCCRTRVGRISPPQAGTVGSRIQTRP